MNLIFDEEEENERFKELQHFKILETPPEEAFDHISELASLICNTEAAMVTFATLNKFWFKANYNGIGKDIARDQSVCNFVIFSKNYVIINDTLENHLTCNHPYVIKGPKIRFYASFPIFSHTGRVLGTVCVHHRSPSSLDESQISGMKKLCFQVYNLLELRVAKDKAIMNSEMKTKFLAHMSHEIRTPMTCIYGMTEILQQSKLNQEQQEYIDIIMNTSSDILRIINDIIDISKIEVGKMTLEKEIFKISDVINGVKQTMMIQFERKGLLFFEQYDDKIINADFVSDKYKIRQVLINLINNALKFTPQGYVKLSVSFVNEISEENKTKLLFEVIDSGVGVTDEAMARLFNDFQQAEAGMLYGGSGLGLSISKHIVNMLGGDIGIKRNKGFGGSTTWFTIICENHGDKKEDVDIENTFDNNFKYDNKNMHILIAEDNATIRRIIARHLNKFFIPHILAGNGLEAINAFEEDEYTMIITDLQMPVMGGVEFAKRVREQNTEIPIIAMTADIFEETRRVCTECGMDDFLQKPFKENELLDVIQRAYKKQIVDKLKKGDLKTG